jgi:hypothetical protein
MDEDSVLKADAENSNSSRMSSTSEATSSCIKNVDPFTFVEVKCEIEVSMCVELISVYCEIEVISFSLDMLCQLQRVQEVSTEIRTGAFKC